MRRAILSIVVVLFAALLCLAEPVATNALFGTVSVPVATNAPAVKVSRQQCEAVIKSGNRCKRNAVPGEKLCRQHLKIVNRKLHSSDAAH